MSKWNLVLKEKFRDEEWEKRHAKTDEQKIAHMEALAKGLARDYAPASVETSHIRPVQNNGYRNSALLDPENVCIEGVVIFDENGNAL